MEDVVVRNAGMAAAAAATDPADLQKSLRRPRSLFSFLMSLFTTLLTLVALAPLFSVISMLILKGGSRLSMSLFTSLPPAPLEEGGGFGNAFVGTLLMVGIAALIAVPFGIMTAVFLTEVGPGTKLAHGVRFGAKILSGFPSVLAGVFAYGMVVLPWVVGGHVLWKGGFSAWAGGVALSLLMLPTVVLTAEEAIRMVPARIREAAIGMGATPTQAIWHVMLPTAFPGILTGVMLAVARAAGETAPLLFTALFSNYWPVHNGVPELSAPTPSLAVLIFNFSGTAYENQIEMAWAAALVLVFLVLAINLIGQSLSRRTAE
jgi:phosphate transport system permease protein